MRLADKSSPSVLPGRRRRGLVRLLVAGPGLRLGLLLVPVLVARWVPWSAVRLVLPLGLVLERRLLAGLIQKPTVFSTDVRVAIFGRLNECCIQFYGYFYRIVCNCCLVVCDVLWQ